jgi:hypothetical protein
VTLFVYFAVPSNHRVPYDAYDAAPPPLKLFQLPDVKHPPLLMSLRSGVVGIGVFYLSLHAFS